MLGFRHVSCLPSCIQFVANTTTFSHKTSFELICYLIY